MDGNGSRDQGADCGGPSIWGSVVPFRDEPEGGTFGSCARECGGAGFSIEVVISSIVFCTFLIGDGRRNGMTNLWVYVVANLLVGLSLALPLYLYRRTVAVEAKRIWSA